ncbi:hypothetical protein ABH935_007027 [Catenulispora sp. GAS73]|uniref:hypothetical protein n=1 Tax=Catenulispora sp. GAS73 TaxID=3156269 RepID=UPI003514F71F
MDNTVNRDALLATLGEMNAAIRAWQIDAARHTDPDGAISDEQRPGHDDARDTHGWAVLNALPDWIAALTEAVGYRTWTIVYRHRDAERASIDAIIGPDLHHALLARALTRHPDWTGLPDDQAIARLLDEDWPGAVAIAGEHTAFIFGGNDDE